MVLRYAAASAAHAKSVVDLIKNRLSADADARKAESEANAMAPLCDHVTKVGLAHAFREEGILSSSEAAKEVKLADAMDRLRREKEEEMRNRRNMEDDDEVMEVGLLYIYVLSKFILNFPPSRSSPPPMAWWKFSPRKTVETSPW